MVSENTGDVSKLKDIFEEVCEITAVDEGRAHAGEDRKGRGRRWRWGEKGRGGERGGRALLILVQKVAALAGAFKSIYYVITKRDQKRRPITEILDNLAYPEILDQPNLARSDIAK